MIKSLRCFSLLTFCFQLTIHATITETSNLDFLDTLLPQLNEHSLVVFDVDETLIIPQDTILRPCSKDQASKLKKEILDNPKVVRKGKYHDGYLLSKIYSKAKFQLVDSDSPLKIQSLQKKGIKVIALSFIPTGAFGVIPNMMNWRTQQLKELGFDFNSAFPNIPFLPLDIASKGMHPIFKQGILATDRIQKGEIFKIFFEKVRWKPNKVVVIDNNLESLKTIETALSTLKIDFLGYHYIAGESYPCEPNTPLAETQFRHLAEFGEWLSEDEAKQLMTNAKSAN